MKNEDGVVMMFILNFDYVVDEESDISAEKISPTSPTKSDQSEYLKGSSRLKIRILKSDELSFFPPLRPVFSQCIDKESSSTLSNQRRMCFILSTLPSKTLVKK